MTAATATVLVVTAVASAVGSGVLMHSLLGMRTRRLERQLATDPLTGIANRRAFEAIGQGHRSGTRLVLAMIDLDRFKDVNDAHGHTAGDETLGRVARCMVDVVAERVGSGGQVFRFGGDEFSMLLPGLDVEHAEALLDEVRARMERTLRPHERGIRLSAGIAASPDHASEWATLVSFADRALYQSKRTGRNRTTAYSTDDLELDDPRASIAMLRVLAMALGAAVDAKDAYTHAHSHNVADLSGYLARTIGMDDHDVDEIFLAGLLHDVGKIGISDAVLKKPGPLDQDEWGEVKQHCEIGYRILNSIDGAERVREMVLSHHERPDGRGYPNGLSGDDIPLGARIIAVADAFDSMTADRVYRRALGNEEALREIVRGRGHQFDHLVVEALCELMLFDAEQAVAVAPIEVRALPEAPAFDAGEALDEAA